MICRRGDGVFEKGDPGHGSASEKICRSAFPLLHQRELIPSPLRCVYRLRSSSGLGARFIWYFHYMPVGNDAAPHLCRSGQREYIYHRIREIRARPSRSSPWTSRTTASMSADASPAAAATCTSTPTATSIRACSSTTPTRTSAAARCSRRCRARSS